MKKISIILCLFFVSYCKAQTLNDFIKQANNTLNTISNGLNGTNNSNNTNGLLNNGEVVAGLKEALRIGAQNASTRVSKPNGFFGNQLIKILMPPEVTKIESTLRSFGFNNLCDNLILSMNRAAEDASAKAVPIFVNAITKISIQDGFNILRGGNTAATDFLRRVTTTALTDAFRPTIQNSLGKVNATKYWNTVFTTYNKLPITRNKVNTDLTAYVTERALNGLFVNIADEERNIRQNPAARVTTLLQRVFK